VSIELRPAFATWLGWVVPDGVPLVVVLDETQDRADLVRQARKIGYERLAGELAGGMAAWRAAGLAESRTPQVRPGLIDRAGLVDVRQADEYAAGHVPGARSIELGALATHAGEVRGDVTVMCGHGQRAATAASLLERAGNTAVRVVDGGPGDWAAAAGQPLATA
jgi:rhodanese-related sulfurtransferase